jgi:phage baseplate assembly protein gpV
MNALTTPDRFEARLAEREPLGWGGRWYGVAPAQVLDIADPDGQNRIKVALPWAPDGVSGRYEAWARLATLFAGSDRGSVFLPEVDDEVLVAFEHGDPRRPFVLGGLWNGKDAPPAKPGSANETKMLKSRNGITVTLKDTRGTEELRLETPGGQSVTLKDGPGAITIQDFNGNSIKLEPSGITVTAAAKVTVNAAQACPGSPASSRRTRSSAMPSCRPPTRPARGTSGDRPPDHLARAAPAVERPGSRGGAATGYPALRRRRLHGRAAGGAGRAPAAHRRAAGAG